MKNARPRKGSAGAPLPDRIDYNSHGDLDDVTIRNVAIFRMERMGDGCFWIRCYCDGKLDTVLWLNSTGKIVGRHEHDDEPLTPVRRRP